MDRHSINLRAAKPTLDEGLAFAHYVDVAAEGFFRFMLGRRATKRDEEAEKLEQRAARITSSGGRIRTCDLWVMR